MSELKLFFYIESIIDLNKNPLCLSGYFVLSVSYFLTIPFDYLKSKIFFSRKIGLPVK